ncbi:MAG TPA: DUF6496 domain-containing protein [Xanthobacteraceae bacterium]|jgi:hypothetical protein|nr:DUF6496 domain-containing protein [Xanthobacteraceae bacterium]
MAKQSRPQKKTMKRVMHEFKHGELETSRGRKVKNPKQAIAIGLREAGASKYESREENARNLRRTKRRERQGRTEQARKEGKSRSRRQTGRGGKTRAELYAQARRRHIPGRSKMDKAELERALRR